VFKCTPAGVLQGLRRRGPAAGGVVGRSDGGPASGRTKSATTGVNPAGDAGDTSPNIFVRGTSTGIFPQYYYLLSDIADQYWLPSVRSASSRFHPAIRRHQFASVRQADSRLTRLVPPTLNSR